MPKFTRYLIMTLVLLFSVVIVSAQQAQTPAEICAAAATDEPETRQYSEAAQVLEEGLDYRAVVCTDAGAVYIDLLETETPLTVNNFVFLAQNNYYNNTIFHRVIDGFMAQGGDPTGTGTGGPGYAFADEFLDNLTFDRPGLLAMANSGPATNGSQLFITTVPTPHLNGRHTIFGKVISGQASVEAIMLRDPAMVTPEDPATQLNTVVIITDPSTVAFDTPSTPGADAFASALEPLLDAIPQEVFTLETVSASTEETVALTPESAQADFAATLEDNAHQFRVINTLNNFVCDLEQVGFVSTSYVLDAFETEEQAAAALSDPAYDQKLVAEGFDPAVVKENSGMEVFLKSSTGCDTDTVEAVAMWQERHFVITASIILPAGDPNVDVIDLVISDFVNNGIFNPMFSTIFWYDIQ